MKRFSLSVLGLIIVITFFLFPFFTVFSFTEIRTNKPQMHYINVSKEENFQMRYTHSIHLTDVLETYKITKDNRLKFISMVYEDVAVGMPAHAEEGQTLTYENGKYKLTSNNKTLRQFTLYVGDINQDLYFYYDQKTYDIKKSLSRGSSYQFEVRTISLYDKMRGVAMIDEDG